jgi:hypothetical protein
MTTNRANDLQEAIYDGCTITTLGEMFGLEHKECKKRLVGKVPPVVPRKDKFERYRIRDAAPYLVDSKIDPEELFKNLSPSKWPPALQDAFWKAQNSKQKWEENRGDLWRTKRVFEVVTNAFKVIRMTILMFVDTVSQRTELSQEQRRIITELGDGLLESLSKALIEEFAFYDPSPDEHGAPLSDSQLMDTEEVPEVEEEGEEVDPFA